MNSLVKAMIKFKTYIIIDTETSINKFDEDMNSLVKYMIMGECNIIIDTVPP